MTFQQQFSNRVIALTGAASGIGLVTAQLLASRGAILSLADISKDALEKVAEELRSQHNTKVLTYALDVRKYDQVESWIKATVEKFGKLDGAANIAGVIPKSIGVNTVEEQDFNEWEFVLGVNLTGTMHCLKAQLREMGDGGSVVNTASIAGLQGRPKNGSYAASKHGVVGLTRSAAKEVGLKGVRVNCICPGRIETPMSRAAQDIASEASSGQGDDYKKETIAGVALGRAGKAEEVGKLIAFLLSDESTYISGAAYSIDGGWNC